METIIVTVISTIGVIITTAIQGHNAKKKDGIKQKSLLSIIEEKNNNYV